MLSGGDLGYSSGGVDAMVLSSLPCDEECEW